MVTAEKHGATGRAASAVEAVKVFGQGSTEVRALDSLTADFERGRFTAIMGPSGSGKSTLLHCMAGLERLTSGKVYIDEVDLEALNEKELTALRRDKIGFIFQSYNLLPMLTAEENITLPLSLAKRDVDAAWMAEIVKILRLGDRLNHKPSELSGGQQQRVAAARALASKPTIVFADEPTGNLDSRRGAELLAFMKNAVEELGQTIVMVTHDPVAASYSHKVVFLADGKIVDQLEQPTVEGVLDRIKKLEA